MGAPVVHFEIISKDAKGLHEFYGNIFGWKIDASNPMGYGLVDTNSEGKGIGGGIGPSEGGAPRWVTFYIAVDDPQAYLGKIEQAGGKTMVPVTEIPNMVTFAVFQDPQGNTVGLVKDEPR